MNPLFRRSLLHALRVTQIICLAVAAMLALLGMPFLVALVFSLLIGNLTSMFVHLGRWSVSGWQVRRGGPATPAQRDGWPGWGWMSLVIGVSVAVAYPLGSLVASSLLGVPAHMPWQQSWRGWSALFAISLLPAVAGTFYFHSRARLAATEAALADLARQAAESQLKLLESQLEPHMLFNTLANLRALIGVDPARAQEMLDRMIAYLRATLSASRSALHPLSAEFSRLADYLALMQVRMGERLQVHFDLPPALADWPVPPLLLQPLAENAIRHGLEPQRGPGSLWISAELDGDRLCLIVRDSGLGLDPQAAPQPGGGFGLTQVRERLRTLYGPDASFSLSASPHGRGTLATLHLPRRAGAGPATSTPPCP